MKLEFIQPKSNNIQDYLEEIARLRGCQTQQEINEFLDSLPPIRNPVKEVQDYSKANDRILHAISSNEKVVIYGDYDCDGITSLVQFINLFDAMNFSNYGWFIPDRMADNYGLTFSGLEKCIEINNPDLIITVDCGSNSYDELNWLKEKNIDCIVLDHHKLLETDVEHPSIAHLNAKAHSTDKDLTNTCASGFTFLFCEQFAEDNKVNKWNKTKALILAGLGTLVDVMPLTGINRALVKHSLYLANSGALHDIPGLVALKKVSKTKKVEGHIYGFQWGPRLNASGRVEEATASVQLLLSRSQEEALPYAENCDHANAERKNIQEKMMEEAMEQAKDLVMLKHKVLVVIGKDWHEGVVGIVASKIKERYNRPAIVCGWNETHQYWKGSGRSIEKFDLGTAVETAVNEGLLLGGGGHEMACGISLSDSRVDDLRNWMNNYCKLTEDDFIPVYTMLGKYQEQDPEGWVEIYEKLEPLGSGNPTPYIYLKGLLLELNEVRKQDGIVWALNGKFKCPELDKPIKITWSDPERAYEEWELGTAYELALKVSKQKKEYGGEKRTFYNWYVQDCQAF